VLQASGGHGLPSPQKQPVWAWFTQQKHVPPGPQGIAELHGNPRLQPHAVEICA